ncbi:hypothetical protein LPJ76_001331 [Coemansia sp. RSA 638]|nr:hypothetical protein LPJ76_001331 [Coemansia sp. RSA 638]
MVGIPSTINIPGMSEVNSVGQSLASFVQSIIVDVTNFNGQVVQQLSVVEQLINIDVSSISGFLETNSMVNGVLLSFTNVQGYYSNVQDAVINFETQLSSELHVLGEQYEQFTSVAGSDINAATADANVRQTQLLKQNKPPTRVQSADAQPIEYMDESEFVHQTATAAHSMSPQSTLHA